MSDTLLFDLSPVDIGDFDPDAIVDEIMSTLQDELDIISSLLVEATGTFSNPPRPQTKIGMEGNDLVGMSFIIDKRAFFLNRGTSVRHAVMHKSFRRKTQPGRLKASAGGGRRRPVRVSRNISMNSPSGKKGITRRPWDDIIVKMRKVPFNVAMERAMVRGSLKTVRGA